MKKEKLLRGILTAVVALALGGCFDWNLELTVNKDGTGTLTETMYFSPQTMALLAMAASSEDSEQPPKNPLESMIDKDELAKKAAQLGKGVTVKSAEIVKDEKGRQGTKVVYAVPDVNAFNLPLQADTEGGPTGGPDQTGQGKAEEQKQETARIQFIKAASGAPAKLKIFMPKPKAEDKAKDTGDEQNGQAKDEDTPDDAESKQAQAMMRQMMGDMRMRLGIKVDGKITKTNATHVSDDKTGITLMDIDFGKLIADEKLFAKLQGMGQSQSFDEVKKMFSDPAFAKFVKIEFEDEVTVEFE